MEKINFQNGVTKVNADTFNTFQDNIEKAITAIKVEILKEENPVGHIRFETTNANPATYLGFGTWVLWGAGRVPVGVDTSQAEFNEVEKIGGSKYLQKHKHSIVNLKSATTFSKADSGRNPSQVDGDRTWKNIDDNDITVGESGSGDSGNLQPYITCYMWKRVS